MILQDIENKVQHIRDIAGDEQGAHGAEDALYEEFIRHVADTGNKTLSAMARECLKTADIDFSRWHA